MKTRIRFVAFVLFVIFASTSSVEADPINHGRFLPMAGTGFILSYGNGNAAPTAFDQDVFCEVQKCGEIKFDYDTFLEKPGGITDGGGALSGGFYIDPSLSISPGHHLAWVQTVLPTVVGENSWRIEVGGVKYPDAPRTTPEYPFTTTAAAPPNPPGPPTLGFQDFPGRLFADGVQSWLAELGLVCIDDTVGTDGFRQAFVIDSLLWGFGVAIAPNTITANAPHLWGPATASYLATLNDYYDGSPPNPPTSGGVSSKFHFQAGCDNCFVPEPGTLTLLVWGVGLLAFVRRARSQTRFSCPIKPRALQV
jgi:hypothetical protein